MIQVRNCDIAHSFLILSPPVSPSPSATIYISISFCFLLMCCFSINISGGSSGARVVKGVLERTNGVEGESVGLVW